MKYKACADVLRTLFTKHLYQTSQGEHFGTTLYYKVNTLATNPSAIDSEAAHKLAHDLSEMRPALDPSLQTIAQRLSNCFGSLTKPWKDYTRDERLKFVQNVHAYICKCFDSGSPYEVKSPYDLGVMANYDTSEINAKYQRMLMEDTRVRPPIPYHRPTSIKIGEFWQKGAPFQVEVQFGAIGKFEYDKFSKDLYELFGPLRKMFVVEPGLMSDTSFGRDLNYHGATVVMYFRPQFER